MFSQEIIITLRTPTIVDGNRQITFHYDDVERRRILRIDGHRSRIGNSPSYEIYVDEGEGDVPRLYIGGRRTGMKISFIC